MRDLNCRTTLDVYTRAVDQQKRSEPTGRGMDAALDLQKFQHPSALSDTQKAPR